MVLDAGTIASSINHCEGNIHSEKFFACRQATLRAKKNSRRILPLGSLAIPHMVKFTLFRASFLGAAVRLDAERTAAAAGALDVRVIELEA